MKIIELLIGSQSFWVIIAVILGVALGEGIRWMRHCHRICTLKKIVREELRSAKNQLIQKKDIVNQAIDHLQKKSLLPTMSVRLIGRGYQENIGELYIHLSDLERNCLHVIFERLRIADELLDSLESNFLSAVKEKIIENPFDAYATRLSELINSYETVEELIESYLTGDPKDVFLVNKTGGHNQ